MVTARSVHQVLGSLLGTAKSCSLPLVDQVRPREFMTLLDCTGRLWPDAFGLYANLECHVSLNMHCIP